MKKIIGLLGFFSLLSRAGGPDPVVFAQKVHERYIALLKDSALRRGHYGEFFQNAGLEGLGDEDRKFLTRSLLTGGISSSLKISQQATRIIASDSTLPGAKVEIDFRDIFRDSRRPIYLNGQRYESRYLNRSRKAGDTNLKTEIGDLRKVIFRSQAGLPSWLYRALEITLLPFSLLTACSDGDPGAANTGLAVAAVDAEYARYLPANYRGTPLNFDGHSHSLEQSSGDEDREHYYLPSGYLGTPAGADRLAPAPSSDGDQYRRYLPATQR